MYFKMCEALIHVHINVQEKLVNFDSYNRIEKAIYHER